MIFKNYW